LARLDNRHLIINTNFVQLDVIANQIHVSQRQLLRIMRTALDESLSAYVARQRVEKGKAIFTPKSMRKTIWNWFISALSANTLHVSCDRE
jgi:AraC-like DNA-binding protein